MAETTILIERVRQWVWRKQDTLLAVALLFPLNWVFWEVFALLLEPNAITELVVAAIFIALWISFVPSIWRLVKQASQNVRNADTLIATSTSFIKLWGSMAIAVSWVGITLMVALDTFNGMNTLYSLIKIVEVLNLSGVVGFVISSLLTFPVAHFVAVRVCTWNYRRNKAATGEPISN